MNNAIRTACAALALSFVVAVPAHAGPYADDLSKCLLKSTTPEDKTLLVKWTFYAMALNPRVAAIVNVAPEARVQVDRDMAAVVEKLFTDSCGAEIKAAVRYEGPKSIRGSFEVLGQVATRELFSDPAVTEGVGSFMKYLDLSKIAKSMGEKK